MHGHKKSIARTCLEGAQDNTLTFPQIVGTLMQEGFEGYAVDFRRGTATYYLPDGAAKLIGAARLPRLGFAGVRSPLAVTATAASFSAA